VILFNAETSVNPTDDTAAEVKLTKISETTTINVISDTGNAAPVIKTPAEAVVNALDAKPGAENMTEELKSDSAGVPAEAEPIKEISVIISATEPHSGETVFKLILIILFTTDVPRSKYKVSSFSIIMYPLLIPSILAINIIGKML
jgi:hypothetical protein